MGLKTSEINSLVASSVASATGAETGRAALVFDMPGSGEVGVASGIILTPTPSVWSMFPWRLEAVEACQSYQLSVRLYVGFVIFSDTVGTPDTRFGTGVGDPGFQANVSGYNLPGVAYSLAGLGSVDLVQTGNTSNRPMEINSSGEISLWYMNNPSSSAYVKAVLTVGAEVVLPFAPFLTP